MRNYRVILLIALISFSSSCNSISNTYNISEKDTIKNTGFIKEDIDSLKVSNSDDLLREGPNTTGVLKEGPNTTGVLKEGPNTTGVLKLTEKFVLLTTEGKELNSPVTPDNIKDIEIIYLRSKLSLKAESIKLKGQDSFTSMSDNEYSAVEYDGNGGFKFSIISTDEDMIVKVNMLDGRKVTLPLINNLDNLKAVILKNNSDVNVKATSYNGDKAYLMKTDVNNQEMIISIDKNNEKQSYLVPDLENKVSNGYKKYDVGQTKTNMDERLSIISGIKEISYISPFVGSWVYKTKNQMINLYIFDSARDEFLWILKVNDTIYQGYNKHSQKSNSKINLYSNIDNNIIDFSLSSNIPNKINLKSNNPLSILGDLDINLTRSIRVKF